MWENTTSYSKSDDRSEIRTTSLELGAVKITVTKYVGYGDELVLHCYDLDIKQRALGETDMGAAQRKAVNIVKKKAQSVIDALEAI
jgi:hypothetical protein